jgi:PIN domain nuclease of toxin-antitoxin system
LEKATRVLDASVLLAYLNDEAGADMAEEVFVARRSAPSISPKS